MINEFHNIEDCIDCKKCMKGCPMLDDFTSSPKSLLQSFKEAKPEVLTYTYPADHGFNCNHRRQYSEVSSKVALDRTLKFLKKNLS